ncbi:hypothetical protein [Mesorhizobium japonicum]|uniref:hypothetical protein n=1 Tax=Mesorhizobium japonicum TaxID=2066070 RepID=UPI003B5AEA66
MRRIYGEAERSNSHFATSLHRKHGIEIVLTHRLSGDLDCRVFVFTKYGAQDGTDHVPSPIQPGQDCIHVSPKGLLFSPAEPPESFLGEIVIKLGEAYSFF